MIEYILEDNYKDFKESVETKLFEKLSLRLEEVKLEISEGIFNENKSQERELIRSIKQEDLLDPNASKELLNNAMKSKNYLIRIKALRNPNSDESHVELGINTKGTLVSGGSHYVRRAAVLHPHAKKSHIMLGLNDINQIVRKAAQSRLDKGDYLQEDKLNEVSKETLTSYTKKASKNLADVSRNFYNPEEDDYNNIVKKSSKIANRVKGIEQAQNKLAAGEYDPEKATKVTMQARYVPKKAKKTSKVSASAMKELAPDYSTDNRQIK